MGVLFNSSVFISKSNIAKAIPVEVVASVDLVPLGVIAANTGITAGTVVAQKTFDIVKFAQKIAGQLLKKLILNRLVDSLVQWIQRDGEGSIIENWDTFFQEAGNAAVGEVAQELGLGFLCKPIDLQLRLLLAPVSSFTQQITCTLDSITANVENFLNDFNQGKWIAYQEQWKPQNNFYGATLIAWDEATNRAKRAEEAAKSEGIANRGFLSFKRADGTIETPGSLVAETATQVLKIPQDAIINADDIAQYITAIVDAYVNQLTKRGIKWLQQRTTKSQPSTDTRITSQNPCSGFTGELFQSCISNQNTADNVFSQNFSTLTREMNGSIETHQQILNSLNATVQTQSEYVNALDKLATCQTSQASAQDTADTKAQLADAQQTLVYLEDKQDQEGTTIQTLQSQATNLSIINPQDWDGLGNEASNFLLLADPDATNSLLQATLDEQHSIQALVDGELPTIEDQLKNCPASVL